MKLAIGNQEAIQLRRRITKLGITQKELATQINVSERYIRDILSTQKTKSIRLDTRKLESILSILGIGLNQVFQQNSNNTPAQNPYLEKYILTLKRKMHDFLTKDSQENTLTIAKILKEDSSINKTMGFWYTLILKTITDRYIVVHQFFNRNNFFNIIPEDGFWRKFRHDSSLKQNFYFSFQLEPILKNKVFQVAYTLESPIKVNISLPKRIKIIYGKIEILEEFIIIHQYHDTPASYRIPFTKNLIITTWLDSADHDFIITSDYDFILKTSGFVEEYNYQLGAKNKIEVSELFHKLGTALFPRNHLFHRQGMEDMGDDPIFFWNNQNFIKHNIIN